MRLALAALAAALVVLVFLSPLATSTRAEPAYPPHEDPQLALSQRDAYHWMTYYGELVGLLLAEDPHSAQDLLEELRLASFPAGLEDYMTILNALLLLEAQGMSSIQDSLKMVPDLVASNRLGEAVELLRGARITYLEMESQLPNLTAAAMTVAEGLGATTAAVGTPQKQALDAVTEKVSKLLSQYLEGRQYIETIRESVQAVQSSLMASSLTVAVDRDTVQVGGGVEVSGRLTSRGQPLPGRTVTVNSTFDVAVSATTGENGDYTVVFPVPYRYEPTFALWTQYIPGEQDSKLYQAFTSRQVFIQVIFYRTELSASLPHLAHPGLPMTVSGQIVSQGLVQDALRHLRLYLDGDVLAEADLSTDFQIEVETPPDTPLGTHHLSMGVDPNGLFSGASADNTLVVELLPTTLHVRLGGVVLAPGSLQVVGTVSSAKGTLANADVRVALGDLVDTVSTDDGGGFHAKLSLSWSPAVFGRRTVNVSADPREPWAAPDAAQASFFVVNLVDVGVLVFGASLLSMVVVRRRSRLAPEPVGAPADQVMPAVSANRPIQVAPRPADLRTRLLMAYLQATEAVNERTGQRLAPSKTLRAYLREVQPCLGHAGVLYHEVTTMAEVALYSPVELTEAQTLRAEDLARQVLEALAHAPA